MGQLGECLGKVYNKTSLGLCMGLDYLRFTADDSCCILGKSVVDYEDVSFHKTPTKWPAYSQMNMAALDVHKWRLVLETRRCTRAIHPDERNEATCPHPKLQDTYSSFPLCHRFESNNSYPKLRTSSFLEGDS